MEVGGFRGPRALGPYGPVVVEPPAHAPLALQRSRKSRADSARLLLFLGAALRTTGSVVPRARLDSRAGVSRRLPGLSGWLMSESFTLPLLPARDPRMRDANRGPAATGWRTSQEGGFIACNFWYADALLRPWSGATRREPFSIGLLAPAQRRRADLQFDPDRRTLMGNFPFSLVGACSPWSTPRRSSKAPTAARISRGGARGRAREAGSSPARWSSSPAPWRSWPRHRRTGRLRRRPHRADRARRGGAGRYAPEPVADGRRGRRFRGRRSRRRRRRFRAAEQLEPRSAGRRLGQRRHGDRVLRIVDISPA